MRGLPGLLVTLALVWLAAVLQQSMAQRLAVFGCEPNFLLAVMAPMALVSRPAVGGWIGFAAGLTQGALAGANLTHYVISRTVAGFLTSLGSLLDIRLAIGVAGLVCAACTLVAQVLFMFLAPPPGGSIVSYLLTSFGTSVYDALLAMPIYALIRRWFGPQTVA
ncbi:MAG TPA: hypothetical protein PLL78_14805 [Fimbriimonadaceae bacterium]|nr:hypothetical protein [Fimbriimonadaceae bacterium]HRJ97943.1 hypothetical protein [Fimbriimonadaceae bacterium]